MSDQEKIDRFLNSDSFAVAGASTDRSKYGNKIFRALRESGRKVYAINPNSDAVEGEPAYRDLQVTPESVESLSIVTPPSATEHVVRDAVVAGVKRIWMQPGAESDSAIREAEAAGMEVIAGGPCVLVALRVGSR